MPPNLSRGSLVRLPDRASLNAAISANMPPWVTPKELFRLTRLRDGRVDVTDQRHTAEQLRGTGRYRVERYLLVETQEMER